MTNHYTNIVAAYLFLINENQVLLLKRHQTGYEDGNFSVIAGHVEAGESFQTTILREAQEEAGILIKPEDLTRTHVQHRKSTWDNSERVDVYFWAEKWQGEPKNIEPTKCSELTWFDLNSLPNNMVACVKSALNCIMNHQSYSEFGWKD